MPFLIRFNKLSEADTNKCLSFNCSNSDLNDFLKEDALPDQFSCISVTRVAYCNDVLVGFFTISNASLRSNELHKGDDAGISEYPSYPAVKIVRIGVQDGYQNQGIGTEMLLRTMVIAKLLSRTIGCRFIIVDAKTNPWTVRFYMKFGFRPQKSMYKLIFEVLQGKYNSDRESVPMYLDILKR